LAAKPKAAHDRNFLFASCEQSLSHPANLICCLF